MAYKLEVARFFSHESLSLIIYCQILLVFFCLFAMQQEGFCFGFVEFETVDAAQIAIEVSH